MMAMENFQNLESKEWWNYLSEDIRKLLLTSEFIYKTVQSWGGQLPGEKERFHDYSFVVFPSAKAYEGFLKKMFLDMGFISEEDYYGKHFRIGKSLNPSLPKELRHESVYNKIVTDCNDGKVLADHLWEAWKMCRNLLFHWFPNEKNAITLAEARKRISMIIDAIDGAFKGCKIKQE